MPSGTASTIAAMRVAVIDVGSNTVRLLVAAPKADGIEVVHQERDFLLLGEQVERLGWITEAKLRETVECVRRYTMRAAQLGADPIEVVITAPGRRAANADELVASLVAGSGAGVRILSAEQEALFGFMGALVDVESVPSSVAVCDSGGGSTELIVHGQGAVEWVRSIDVGSLAVRRLLPGDPPGRRAVKAASADLRGRLAGLEPPTVSAAYAIGGTARGLRRLIGPTLDQQGLARAIHQLATCSTRSLAKQHALDKRRAWTLAGGAIVLAEIQLRLGIPLQVVRTGMREGIAAASLSALAAA